MQGEYTAQLIDVQWSLDRRSIAISEQDDQSCTVLVTSMPSQQMQFTLTCRATFEGNREVVGTTVITVDAATAPSSIAITGPASMDALQDYDYQVDPDTLDYTASVESIQWSLTQQAYVTISNNRNRCRLTVNERPSADMTLQLSCEVTFNNGTILTTTKQIALVATTIPTALVITGDSILNAVDDYNFTQQLQGEYSAELLSVVWSLTPLVANAHIASQSSSAATVEITALPESGDQSLVLTCVATFSGSRTVTGTKNLTVSQRQYTYPTSVEISGAAAIAAAGNQNYVKQFDTDNFDAEVLNVQWSLNEQSVATIASQTAAGATLNVATMPQSQTLLELTVDVTFTRNVHRTATKQITVNAATYPVLAISGAAAFAAAGTETYQAQLTGAATAVVASHAWSLSQQQVAVISSSTDEQALIAVAQLPAAAITVVLTHTVTYTNGHTQSETKSITIPAATYNTYAISGDNNINDHTQTQYTRTLLTSGNVAVTGEHWEATAPLTIVQQGSSTVDVQVITMPTASTQATISHVVEYADGHTETTTKTVTVAAATYPAIAINGNAEVNEAGTQQYTRVLGGSHAADYTAIIQSSVWSLSQSANASISAQTADSCTLAVTAVPQSPETLTLTLTVTYTDGTTDTQTKTITLQESVAPADLVDLGLPSGILWAKGNIVKDAQGNYAVGNETDFGCYFSWGNIIGHNDDESYDFSENNYNNTPGGQLSSSIASNDSAHDAALATLGGSYHMPTKVQFKELYDNTDNEWTTIDGVTGRKFMKKTDHSIYVFFPAAGYRYGTNKGYNEGDYWSSTLYSGGYSNYLTFGSSSIDPQYYGRRYYGYSVRAVQNPA